ncbi:MAG: MmgE/PrpD family protein [Acidimicrobiia bacterium]|nr:MmgE/PrpD family protein [Acidimicrobiia bacterium]
MSDPRVADIGAWAAELVVDDVPPDVLALARDQRRSVLASVAASTRDGAARRVLAAVETWAHDGPVVLPGTERRVAVEDALYGAAALSMALDFDDYVCFGHTGHSGVLVPLALAAETGASGPEQLVAQTVANEVEARLGGACLVGPLNGQLWSFIHGAGAALAAGRLLGLDATGMAHALALALSQAPRATVPGFMAPDSKLLTAAEPTVMGIRAARLAAAGVSGPLDVLEHPEGFLAAFADAPLPGMLDGLGEGWATRTLCVKPYPGCAYLDTIVDALLELGPPAAAAVEHVVVEASLLTCEMDRMSRPYASLDGTAVPTPVTTTFSVPWNVAMTLVAGRLTPAEVAEGWLATHADELRRVAHRVTLRHDWALTRQATDAFGRLIPFGRVAGQAGLSALARSGARLRQRRRRTRVSVEAAGGGELRGLHRMVWPAPDLTSLRSRRPFWDPRAVDSFAMTFPASVRVFTVDGAELVAECARPRGGAGNTIEGPGAVSRAKLAAYGPWLWGDDRTEALAKAVDADEDDLWARL